MDLEKLANWRKKRLQDFVDLKFGGSKAALGRALGYKDGAFVGQMIRGDRPITEKTVDQIQSLPGGRNWFDKGSKPEEYKPDFTHTVQSGGEEYKVKVELKTAVEQIAAHLQQIQGYDRATATLLLSTLANDPSMAEIVAAGLRNLKPEVRGDPGPKHGSPAPISGTN